MSKPYSELHDALLKSKPDGADHDTDKCPLCSSGKISQASQEENVDEAKFTQEQLDQLVSAAVEKATDEVKASTDAETIRLNEQLKAETEKAEAAETKVSELETSISDRDEAERLVALAEERAELVKAAVNFSDEQIEQRKESWATKTSEEFDALIEDYKAAAAAASVKDDDKKVDDKLPKSKFDGTRQTAGDETGPDALSAFFGTELVSTVQS